MTIPPPFSRPWRPWLLATVLCLLSGVAPALAAAPQNVLILSEGPVLPYGVVLREGIITALRQDGQEPLTIYEELIDRIRFDSDEYDQQLVTLYKAKYVNAPPALIITITEPALDFALRHRRELFPNAALLFTAVDERAIRERTLDANVTGVFSHIDARKTLEAALAVHPGTRHIVVVGGMSRLDRGYIDTIQEDLRGFASPASVSYITDKSLSQVLAAVAALGNDGLVLFVSMQSDGAGVARTGPEVLAELRRVAAVPIYGMSGNFLDHGIVGGVLFEMPSHAIDVARRARQILAGGRPAELPPMRSPNRLAFDGRELKRFGIDAARLPAGARVINRELSFWEAYRRTVFGVAAVLIGQSVLIGGLWVQGRRRRRAELALQNLSGRLLTAQEEERHRIARELHDNLSQQVALLAIEIEQVATQPVRQPGALTRALRHLGKRTGDISTEIHNMSHRLHSAKLEALGLAAAVRGHCHEVLTHGVKVHFSDDGAPPAASPEVQLCLFRIIQEGLNNVVKHSGAREAHVTLSGRAEALVVTITDAGCGFDPAAAGHGDGLGLASMRERLRLIGGELNISSRPGQGTTIDARVPLTPSANRPALADSVRVA